MSQEWIQCAMTGRLYRDSSLGIWDDGEWISWESIDDNLDKIESREKFPFASDELIEIFENLVWAARDYYAETGRYLSIWGELGELYAELALGVKRHPVGHPGSDGILDDEEVEIKTISPVKSKDHIVVKSAGPFRKLLVVRISASIDFEARLIDRDALRAGRGSYLIATWSDFPRDTSKSGGRASRLAKAAGIYNEEEE